MYNVCNGKENIFYIQNNNKYCHQDALYVFKILKILSY